ncbi:MAG: hypothetical protein ACYCW6_16465 [Candidatus Xenobia bacterium]
MKKTVTLTTIHVPRVIEAVEKNRRHFGHDDVDYVVAGDQKSPPEAAEYVQSLKGIPIEYLDVPRQEDYLARYPELAKFLPYNSFARRNIADLWAFEHGADVIIRIDDDNFPLDSDDFIGGHEISGQTATLPVATASDGLYNCCDALETANGQPFYPRGYPYPNRWVPHTTTLATREVRVGVCAGLWSGDPDVDAVTRLHRPVEVTALKAPDRIAVAKGSWCPINTQNTSYRRDIIPAAFVPPNVGRYDDIFSGYCMRAIMDALGDSVVYGRPLLHQDRNVHDLWKDLEHEMFGNRHAPHLLEVLRAWTCKATRYGEAYAELATYLKENLQHEGFRPLYEGMLIWAGCFEECHA